jgi:hypothetical protein
MKGAYTKERNVEEKDGHGAVNRKEASPPPSFLRLGIISWMALG